MPRPPRKLLLIFFNSNVMKMISEKSPVIYTLLWNTSTKQPILLPHIGGYLQTLSAQIYQKYFKI